MNTTVLIVILSALGQVPSSSDLTPKGDRDGVEASKRESPKVDAAVKNLDALKQTAARYRITVGTDPPRDLGIAPEPVLSWTNPLRSTFAGASFVWLADGRPEAIASLYRYTEDGKTVEDHEFQSLATTSLSATRAGRPIWAPQGAGIALAPIPGAPRPAASPPERLRQMQAMAKEFHAFTGTERGKSELRLLPKPLCRYQTNRPDLADGALFAFVLATDPEVLLMIEARPVDGSPAWHYGFARMSMVDLRARHKDRDVWSADWVTDLQNPNRPYVTLRSDPRPD
jgi:hypothetical protein